VFTVAVAVGVAAVVPLPPCAATCLLSPPANHFPPVAPFAPFVVAVARRSDTGARVYTARLTTVVQGGAALAVHMVQVRACLGKGGKGKAAAATAAAQAAERAVAAAAASAALAVAAAHGAGGMGALSSADNPYAAAFGAGSLLHGGAGSLLHPAAPAQSAREERDSAAAAATAVAARVMAEPTSRVIGDGSGPAPSLFGLAAVLRQSGT
jgi:hypothetical protein